ncbi:putative Leu/Ile/Val-binding lipoprotein transmembrane [Parafrankia sp. Ea1.12]|nr:putative Leu/Ile/Val-binding lipoprotein transmembrane [Parafrankia sp. Ea1.12]
MHRTGALHRPRLSIVEVRVHLGRTTRLLGVAAAVLVAAVTSCSSAPGAASAAACDSPGVTPGEVNLGLVYSDSGVGSAAFASARAGADARFGLANEEGGVHGRKIVYQWRDDANDPSQNARVVQELLRGDSAFGLVTITTAFGSAPADLAKQNVPVVGFGLPTWAEYQNMFSTMYQASPVTIGRYLRDSGGSKVGVVITGSSASTLDVIKMYKSAFESVGLTVTDTISYAHSVDSPAHVAQQLAASGVNALVGFTTTEDLAEIMGAVRTANLNLATTVSFTGYDQGLLPTLGPALAGVSIPAYFRPFEAGGAAIDRYRAAMVRYAPEATQPDQQFAMNAYIYADMFVRGLDLAGDCPTRDGFINALRSVSDYDAGGLIEPVDLATNRTGALNCYAFVQVNPTGTGFQVARPRLCADGTTG